MRSVLLLSLSSWCLIFALITRFRNAPKLSWILLMIGVVLFLIGCPVEVIINRKGRNVIK